LGNNSFSGNADAWTSDSGYETAAVVVARWRAIPNLPFMAKSGSGSLAARETKSCSSQHSFVTTQGVLMVGEKFLKISRNFIPNPTKTEVLVDVIERIKASEKWFLFACPVSNKFSSF